MTREEAIAELSVLHERLSNPKDCEDGCYSWEDGQYVEALDMAIEALQDDWIPCSERLPDKEDCPMDCMVTMKSTHELIGNIVDMAVAEKDGTWTHENWQAIVVEGEARCISIKDREIIAWKPLPKPYKAESEEV